MDSDRAQLSALATNLDDLRSHITEVADRHRGSARDDVAVALYEVERSLMAASRQLVKVLRSLA